MKRTVIIGAGIGGLFAGNLLAQKGHKVTIFESHSMPGGYTAGFWRNGFYFESGTISFEASSLVFKAMKEIGVFEKIGFIRHNPIRFVSQDYSGTPKTYEEFKNMFYNAYPSERARLARYFAEVDTMYRVMKSLSSTGSVLSKIVSGSKALTLFQKYNRITLNQFTERYFEKDSRLYRIFTSLGYPDMAPFILGGAVLSLFEDYWRVRDGMQSWADVLNDNFQKLGGELKLNSYVDKVLTRNRTALGVRCKQSEYEADYVIAANDYKKTFLQLLDKSDIPQALYTKIQNTNVSEGMCVVYLGLNLSNEELQRAMQSSYVMYIDLSVNVDIHNSNDRDYFKKTGFSLFSPSIDNPKLAPEGKSSLMISTIAPYHWMNNWGGNDRQTYLQLKEDVINTLINRASFVIPNLQNVITFKDAATPPTFERYTHNTDGATSAWSWNPQNRFYKNFWSFKVTTPVKNLFIGSCWATQIGGIPGALGAASRCVKKIT